MANGESGPRKFDPLATWADLALAVKSLYTEASSGAACPGLIEAAKEASEPSERNIPHPGLLAPASLKLGVTETIDQEEANSSGAACPGLIEAGLMSSIHARVLMPHPGLLAPASLKRRRLTIMPATMGPHPGLLAPASLKRWRADDHH